MKDFECLLDLLACADSDESSDEDIAVMLISLWPEPVILGSRINLDDFSDQDCTEMFR